MKLRRVQLTGKSTYTISLPKTWIKANEIKEKENLEVIPVNDQLLIRVPFEGKRESLLSVGRKGVNQISREIIARYIKGADRIIIEGAEDLKLRKKIREFVLGSTIGLELTKEGEKILLQSIIDASKLKLADMFERLNELVGWMYRNAFKAIKERNEELCKYIITRDKEVNRLALLASRQMFSIVQDPLRASEVGISTKEVYHYKAVIENLERIADAVKSISKASVILTKLKISQKTLEGLEKESMLIEKLYKTMIQAFKEKSVRLANKTIEQCILIENPFLSRRKGKLITYTSDTKESMTYIAIILENLAIINTLIKDMGEAIIDNYS